MAESQQPRSKSASFGESDWRNLVERSLRGRQFESLTSQSDDGLAMGPIYRSPTQVTDLPGRPAGVPWTVVQRIDDPDSRQATAFLAADLAGGAAAIELVFSGSAAARRTGFGLDQQDGSLSATLLAGNAGIRIDAGEASYSIYKAFFAAADNDMTLAFDPLAHAAAQGGFDRPLAGIEAAVVAATSDFEECGRAGATAIADGRIWAAGGASEAQELSAILGSLAHLVRLLLEAGLAPQTALQRIAIAVDAGANQSLTIAKLRAVRLVHARFVAAFGLPPIKATVHAETSWRMMTRRDVHTNILRTTSAAFAAGIGGADSITVLPFTIALGLPDAFARRVARSSQTLMIEEAGLARVGDPAGGSGAIEWLTTALAEAAWSQFRAIEAAGGLLAMLRSGSFQAEIGAMRGLRSERIARRQIKITGVSEFPMLETENVSVARPFASATVSSMAVAEPIPRLDPARLSETFEGLHDRAAALAAAGRPPGIFLAGLGKLSDFTERTAAAANFFAAGGIRAIGSASFDTVEAAAEAFAFSGARAACIVGAEQATHRLSTEMAEALQARGAMRVYFASDQDTIDTASLANIEAIIGEGVNAIDVLNELLRILEGP